MKIRIDTSGRQSALQSPFAGLQLDGLPEGPAEPLVPKKPAPPTRFGRVVLRREKAQRGGKTVVVVHDFEPQITAAHIDQLAREARQACGCGGTVRGREIELQGDNPQKVRVFFESAGFRVAGV
ncbi:MAG: translation initiation factor [Terrimicrobiaceae bacterium]